LALPVDASLTKRDMQRIVSACNALGGLLQTAM
ncbi:DegT/DnrJ/EryC1/StrS aminotransferase, partial [Streptomyces sp. TRM76130]|nr:DegT/DnrJ/EryC1/StrS aminotransferase [Streptomyces sp. TRM76130]